MKFDEIHKHFSSPERLHEEYVKKTYNNHYHTKHLQNGIKKHSLIDDDPKNIMYPQNPGILDLRKNFVLSVMRSFCHVVPDQKENYEGIIKNIFESLKYQSVVIVTNHETFANIPILVSQIHTYAEKYTRPEIKENLHTILGPSLMTQTQKNLILSISNVVKTIPDTWNSDIPSIKEDLQSIRRKFLLHIVKEIEQTQQDLLLGKRNYGNIYFLAPTGMRDYLKWNENGTIDSIIFEEDKELKGSLGLISSLNKRGVKVVLAGTNTVGLKRPSRVKEKDNNFVPSDGYIALQELSVQKVESLIEHGTFMQTLSRLVKDHDGKQVAKVSSREDIKSMRDNHTAPEIDEDAFRNFHFHDTLGKITTRLIFRISKILESRKSLGNKAKEILDILRGV